MSNIGEPEPGSPIEILGKCVSREVLETPASKTILVVTRHGLQSGLKGNLDDVIIQSLIDCIMDKVPEWFKEHDDIVKLKGDLNDAFRHKADTKDDNSFLEMLNRLVGLATAPLSEEALKTADSLVASAGELVSDDVRVTNGWKSVEAFIRLGLGGVLDVKIVEGLVYYIGSKVPARFREGPDFNKFRTDFRGEETKRISVAIEDRDDGDVIHVVVMSNSDGDITDLQALTVGTLKDEIRKQIHAAPETFDLFHKDKEPAIVEGTFQERGISDGMLLSMRAMKPGDESGASSANLPPGSTEIPVAPAMIDVVARSSRADAASVNSDSSTVSEDLSGSSSRKRPSVSGGTERQVKRRVATGATTEVSGDDDSSKPSWINKDDRYCVSSDLSVFMPHDVYASLFAHQKTGVLRILTDFLSEQKGLLLGDDVGMGKTRTAVASAFGLILAGKLQRVFVSCPAKVEKNWVVEAKHMKELFGLRQLEIHNFKGDLAPRMENWKALKKRAARSKIPIFVVSSQDLLKYDNPNNPLHTPTDRRFELIIQDEAHHAKNNGHIRKVLRGKKYAEKAFLLLLTATPMQNSGMELGSLLDTVSKSKIFSDWFTKHQKSISEGRRNSSTSHQRKIKDDLLKELATLATPYFLQRSKIGVLNSLPELTRSVIFVDLSRKQEEADREILDEYNSLPEGSEAKKNVMKVIGLRRAVSISPFFKTPLKDDPDNLRKYLESTSTKEILSDSPKLNACVALTRELVKNDHKTIIFCATIGPLKFVERVLTEEKIACVSVYGSCCKREQIVSDFNDSGSGIKVMLATTAKLGEGVNLQGADRAIVLAPMWNPYAEAQAIGRLHRIGQDKPVEVFHLVSRGSVEISVIGKQINKIAGQKETTEKTGGLQHRLHDIKLKEMLYKNIDKDVVREVDECFPPADNIEQVRRLIEADVVPSADSIRKYDIYKRYDYLYADVGMSVGEAYEAERDEEE